MRYDDRGEKVEVDENQFGGNVLIVSPEEQLTGINRVSKADAEDEAEEPPEEKPKPRKKVKRAAKTKAKRKTRR